MKKTSAIVALVAVAAVALCAAVRFVLSPPARGGADGAARAAGVEAAGGGPRADAAKGAKGVAKPAAKPAKKKKPKNFFPVDEMAPTAVVARVNGAAVTRADYSDWYRLKDRIFRARHGIPANGKPQKLVEFARDSRSRMCMELVKRELVRRHAAEKGVTVPPERLAKAERAFAKKIGRKDGDFAALAESFGPRYGELLKAAVAAEELEKACVEAFATNSLTKISDEEVEAQLKRVREANANAEKKNAEQREKALAVRAEILAKAAQGGAAAATPAVGEAVVDAVGAVQEAGKAFDEAFAEVTAKSADLAKDEGAEWDTVELGEFQADDALALWLMAAKPGDVSGPMDMEDGLAIVGLKRKYMGEAPDGIKPQMQFEVVRCVFYAYEIYEEPDSLAELAKEMLALRRRQAAQALGDFLMEKADIEYPLGEGIFRPAMRKTKKPAAKVPPPADRSSGGHTRGDPEK